MKGAAMMRIARFIVLSSTVLIGTLARADAEEGFAEAFMEALSNGPPAAGAALAEARLASDPGDRTARFALGTAQFLSAVEGLGRDLYRHGFATGRLSVAGSGMGLGLPRFAEQPTATPEPVTFAALQRVLADFGDRLMQAEATLAEVQPGPTVLPLDLAAIRLDMNGDGTVTDAEEIGPMIRGALGLSFPPEHSTFNFDESDVFWLRGYCHLLAGMTDFLLAYDWSQALDETMHNLFPEASLGSAPLGREFAGQLERLFNAEPARSFYEAYGYYAEDPADPLYAEWASSEEGQRWLDAERIQNALMFGAISDAVAFVHLTRWPVIAPERMRSSRDHLLQMIAMSRANWNSILAETDDDLEWVPGPEQTSWVPRLVVQRWTVDGWNRFLDQFEGVLEGRLLIPHWRFDRTRGLNVRRMFDEPRTFDPVMLLQGFGALPYLEPGTMADDATADTAFRILNQGFLGYFIWFN